MSHGNHWTGHNATLEYGKPIKISSLTKHKPILLVYTCEMCFMFNKPLADAICDQFLSQNQIIQALFYSVIFFQYSWTLDNKAAWYSEKLSSPRLSKISSHSARHLAFRCIIMWPRHAKIISQLLYSSHFIYLFLQL